MAKPRLPAAQGGSTAGNYRGRIRRLCRKGLCRGARRRSRQARGRQQRAAVSVFQDQGRAVQGGHQKRRHSTRRRAATRRRETELSSEDFIRGPLLEFMKADSAIAGGHRYSPAELPRVSGIRTSSTITGTTSFEGPKAISRFVERGVERGEFRQTVLEELPQLVLAPMMLSMIWGILFTEQRTRYRQTHGNPG